MWPLLARKGFKGSEDVRRALARDRVIDITTIGRKTRTARRTEIWFHNLDGRIFISGLPGRRSWYANMLANPVFTFHLKQSVRLDLAARARPITDKKERRLVLEKLLQRQGSLRELESWVSGSPLVEVTFAES